MKYIVIFACLLLAINAQQRQGSLKNCISSAFNSTCKSQLYNCLNASDCSYQLHTNTQHIFIKEEDTAIPKMYFSNSVAIKLH